MQQTEKAYKKLCSHTKSAALLNATLRLVEWDQETNMPAQGLQLKADQNKLLQELIHKQMTSKKYVTQLDSLIDIETGHLRASDLKPEQSAVLRELRRDYLLYSKLNATFLKKFTDATTHALDAWKQAKKANQFKLFLPHLEKIIALSRKKADLLGYKDHHYNALLDIYEPEASVAVLDPLFSSLKAKIVPLLQKIQSKQNPAIEHLFDGKIFPIGAQKRLCSDVLLKMGLTSENHHLAESAHPFCMGLYPQDIRLTTHFNEKNFLQAFLAAMHEGGHGLYEAGFAKESFGTPMGEAASYAVHESQSRIWETCIGHSKSFWHYYYPHLKEYFPDALKSISSEELYQYVNFVKPTLIRIFSDEVTYNLHIILRYELEKGFMDGTLSPKNLPELWNTQMHSLLGIMPKKDSEGCLQDIHWSLGYIGYFPSYTLGNLYAGALFHSLTKHHPNWDQHVAQGDFTFIRKFLQTHVHQWGRQFPPKVLIEKATGSPFSIDPYISYLSAKYL